MATTIWQQVEVSFCYPVYFTTKVFSPDNPILAEALSHQGGGRIHRTLFVLDSNVAKAHRNLIVAIERYSSSYSAVIDRVAPVLIVPGGENAKQRPHLLSKIQRKIHQLQLCRHSFVVVIGGGAVLDMVGFAIATPHRGLRLVRVPTTVVAQNDSGVGVKNAVNAFGKKNFFGTFAPPFAVINDASFLTTLDDRDWRAGIAEAIKVALLKDGNFFAYITRHSDALLSRDLDVMQQVIQRCAELHLQHISSSGDPFELGHSRPLDFGHWAAHKLESLSGYRLRHGEAVAVGMAIDSCYSFLQGWLSKGDWLEILTLLNKLRFRLYYPLMSRRELLAGLSEFREHLGGTLCITLLSSIATPFEVNEIDETLMLQAIEYLKRHEASYPESSPYTPIN